MVDRKQIDVSDGKGGINFIQWVGPIRPNKKFIGYLRLESGLGEYLGSPNDRHLRRIYNWLKIHYGDDK